MTREFHFRGGQHLWAAGSSRIETKPVEWKDTAMLDVIFVAASVFFVVVAIAYVHACERLKREGPMTADNATLLLICAGICAYLLYALLRPEKF